MVEGDQERLSATVGTAPGPGNPHIHVDRQMSTDSAAWENPFRAGGELSKDAENIVSALKQGKLSVVSMSPSSSPQPPLTPDGVEAPDGFIPEKEEPKDITEINGVKSKEKVAEVQHGVVVQSGFVVNTKQTEVEHIVIPEEKKKKCSCCVIQ